MGDERFITAANTFINRLLMFNTYIFQGEWPGIHLTKQIKNHENDHR